MLPADQGAPAEPLESAEPQAPTRVRHRFPWKSAIALLAIVALVLGFCWSLLIGLSREGEPEYTAVANELLLQELIVEQPEALPAADLPTAIAPPLVAQNVDHTGHLLS